MQEVDTVQQNKKRRIPLVIALAVVLLAVVAVLAVVWLVNRSASDGLTVYLDDGVFTTRDQVLFSDRDDLYVPLNITQDNHSDSNLLIKKSKNTAQQITLVAESGAGQPFTQELVFEGRECRLSLEAYEVGEYDLSLIVKSEETVRAYVSAENGFLQALSDGNNGNLTVFMLDDICISDTGDLTVNTAFDWQTNGRTFQTSGAIRFVSETAGAMRIANTAASDIACGGIYCDTPQWTYQVDTPFDHFTEQQPFYVYAKSVNGRTIDCSLAVIDSAEKVTLLTDPSTGVLALKPYQQTVRLCGDFTVDAMTINRLVSLEIAGNVAINQTICINSTDEGTMTVSDAENSVALSDKIVVEAPHCRLQWEGAYAPTLAFAEQYMNVFSFNGTATDGYMGGAGTAQLASVVFTDSLTGSSVQASPDGYCIDLQIGYADNLEPSRVTAAGEFSQAAEGALMSSGDTYYYIVTDSTGKARGYKVNFNSVDYRLPIIHISTDGGQSIDTKDTYIGGSFSIDYNGAYEFANLQDVRMGIKGRGNSSWELEKKPYKIKFETGTSLFGLHKAKRWVLIANHSDRSLIRNRLAYSVGTVLDNMLFIPSAYMVDVFVNGRYAGVYQLSEQLEVNKGRVPGEEDSTEIDTDYFLEYSGEETLTAFGDNIVSNSLFRYAEIKNPDADVLTEEQYNYIQGYADAVEQAIVNGGDYASLLDVPSLVDWFLLYEFSYNLDGIFRRSDFLLKVKGDKLYFCSPWDFDGAFGNMSLDSDHYAEWICLGNSRTDAYDMYIDTNMITYLIDDPLFVAQLKQRWQEVGAQMLSLALETIEDARTTVAPSAEENFKRWNILGTGDRIQYENRATVNIDTYEGQLDYLKTWVTNRYAWMDATIAAM